MDFRNFMQVWHIISLSIIQLTYEVDLTTAPMFKASPTSPSIKGSNTVHERGAGSGAWETLANLSCLEEVQAPQSHGSLADSENRPLSLRRLLLRLPGLGQGGA